MISIVPLVTVMLAVFSAFPIFSTLQETLQRYFASNLFPDTIAKPVLGAMTQFSTSANRLGLVGLAVLLVSVIALMLTIDKALNAIWRVKKPRPIAQRVLVYWSAMTLGPLLLASASPRPRTPSRWRAATASSGRGASASSSPRSSSC